MILLKPDKLSSLTGGRYPSDCPRIEGHLGQRMDACISRGVMAVDSTRYVMPFTEKIDDHGNWGGEFWGKWMTSAVLACRYSPTPDYIASLQRSVTQLIAAQEPDGRLSSSHVNFADWDIWGRKYALLGLLSWYDFTGDTAALMAAIGAADALIAISGPGKTNLAETGLSVLQGLSSSSILEPIALLYQRTGYARFLDFAKQLVASWSQPNRYTHTGIQLIEHALAKTYPVLIASGKGYEMMSCFEGLCELYRCTGEQYLLDAVVSFAHMVCDREIMIVGSGSSGELWCDGSRRQSALLEQPMETCVTATWMKLCNQLLRLTGDPYWADALEISLYNALLGAMMPDGKWWAYFSPLAGVRLPSPVQVPAVQSSCCVVNGPRALLAVPDWAVMKRSDGIVINLYAEGTWPVKLNHDHAVTIRQMTQYPRDGMIRICIDAEENDPFIISLRIPAWSCEATAMIRGQTVKATPGSYLVLQGPWNPGDIIDLNLNMSGRMVSCPDHANEKAVMYGPLVLSLDNRMTEAEEMSIWLKAENDQHEHDDGLAVDFYRHSPVRNETIAVDVVPAKSLSDDVWLSFTVPAIIRPTHYVHHRTVRLNFCDYASAGNQFSRQNQFRTWLPQPLWMHDLYPAKTDLLLGERLDHVVGGSDM